MKKQIAILMLAGMLLSACGKVTPSDDPLGTLSPDTTANPESSISPETTKKPDTTAVVTTTALPETTVSPETTAPVYPSVVPDITIWDGSSHEVTDLLLMKVGDIKSKYGALTLVDGESAVNTSLYKLEKLAGVLLVFENRDRTSPLSDTLIPDRIKVTEEYVGKVAGVAVGEVGEDAIWNDATCSSSPVTYLYGKDFILSAVREETEGTFPDGYPGWDNDKLALWRESFCRDPIGKITDITIEKRRESLPHGELEVISNLYNTSVHDVEIPLRTAYATYEVFDYDDRYVLYVVKNKNIAQYVNMNPDLYSVELFVVDSLEGKIIHKEELAKIAEGYGYGGCSVIFLQTETGGELALWESTFDKLTASYDVFIGDTGVALTKKDSAKPYPRGERFTSTDGKYTIYNVIESATESNGGIDLVMPNGSYTRLLTNKPGYEQVEIYSAVGFVDGTTFAYSIGGWEHIKGYGTYNIETGEKKEYRGSDYLIAAHDGYIYIEESEKYDDSGMRVRTALCSIDKDGSKKRIAATTVFRLEDGKRIYISEAKAGEVDITNTRKFFEGTGWLVIGDTVNFYSADFSKLLVSIEAPTDNIRLYDNVHTYNRTITVVTPRYKG